MVRLLRVGKQGGPTGPPYRTIQDREVLHLARTYEPQVAGAAPNFLPAFFIDAS
jgi:hypothetical protein